MNELKDQDIQQAYLTLTFIGQTDKAEKFKNYLDGKDILTGEDMRFAKAVLGGY